MFMMEEASNTAPTPQPHQNQLCRQLKSLIPLDGCELMPPPMPQGHPAICFPTPPLGKPLEYNLLAKASVRLLI